MTSFATSALDLSALPLAILAVAAAEDRPASAVKMADYKRQREAPIFKEPHGIELPPAIE